MLLGQRLRQLRRQANFTQRDLAQKVGVHFSYLSKLENGTIPSGSETVINRLAHEIAVKLGTADETELTDELVALAGKLPSDLIGPLADNFRALVQLRRLLVDARSEQWKSNGALKPRAGQGRQWSDGTAPPAETGTKQVAVQIRRRVPTAFRGKGGIEALRKSPVFANLDHGHLTTLLGLAEAHSLRRAEFLFLEGDPVDHCYLVASGMIRTVRHSPSGTDFVTAIHGPGQMLANTLLFGSKACHPSSAQAMTESRVLLIRREHFISFLRRYPGLNFEILTRMLNVAGKRYEAAVVRLGELAAESADYRMARTLLSLNLEFGPSIPLTHREIAEMAGTTTETVTRFISRLRQSGVVQSFRGNVSVVDHDKLRMLV